MDSGPETARQLAAAQEENERLAAELKRCKADLAALTGPRPAPTLRRTLSTPKNVALTEEELAAMHATFSLFAGSSGTVKAADLQHLHQALGEPLSDEEAREAVAIMAGGRDAADFDAFVDYWVSTGPYGDRYHRLRAVPSAFTMSTPSSAVAADSGAAAAPAAGGAGAAFVSSPVAMDPETREHRRQWYQVRFRWKGSIQWPWAVLHSLHDGPDGRSHC